MGYHVVGVYLLDSQFMQDTPKFFAGVMYEYQSANPRSAMSAMLQLGIPHINVMSKWDLVQDKHAPEIERQAAPPSIDEFSMVNFIPLDIHDEDSITYLLSHIDNAIQFGEDAEPRETKEFDEEDE
ncbi:hypothetical protein HDU91_005890 [Kappamyces sp. JEL0680]|nr:hypothetical protein HDU91_005890 [Kappamyces sp. JEL0680]